MNRHAVHVEIIPERPGAHRLGRHVVHDSRSRGFDMISHDARLVSKVWQRHCPPFDQGNLGSCTVNAGGGCAMTEPLYQPGRTLTEPDLLPLYRAATRLDYIPGHWEPDDTGSSGLAACKAMVRAGLAGSYRHCFGLAGALNALSHVGSIMIGIDWFAGFDTPQGPGAELVISGEVRGGHEVQLNEISVERRIVRGPNSWGTGWGDGGYFTMSWDTFDALLKRRGDVMVPLP